jgi:cation transport ATPase
MTRTYRVTGMHCAACEQTVRKALMMEPDVRGAKASATSGTVELDLLRAVPEERLRALVAKTGLYTIAEEVAEPTPTLPEEAGTPTATTYFPLILLGAFITGVAFLAQWPLTGFDGMLWMRHFMAGFFLCFSFFKLLDLRGFASSYRMYDPIARRVPQWGTIYPFVELALGVLYVTGLYPIATAWITVVVMGISAIGPIQSVLNKQKIRCACLGAVFNLPMSTVTIVEDLLMVAMASAMLIG